jgi:hypothetical protein
MRSSPLRDHGYRKLNGNESRGELTFKGVLETNVMTSAEISCVISKGPQIMKA